MRRILTRLFAVILIVCLTVPAYSASAVTRVGGYNKYRGKSYKLETFDELRERLVRDRYFQLKYDDNPLADTSFDFNYLVTEYNSQYYEVWVNEDDYNDYKSATVSGAILTSMGIIEDNAVIIGWYEYREVDEENPTGKLNNDIPADWERGTIQFISKMGEGYKGNITVTLFESQRKEYYQFVLHEENNWEEINLFPEGRYYIANIYLSDDTVPIYDEALGMNGDGFGVSGGSSKIIYIGYGTTDIPNASWKEGKKVKLLHADSVNSVKEESPKPQKTEEEKEKPELPSLVNVTDKNDSDGMVIIWVVLAVLAFAIVIIVVHIKRKRGKDEF